MVKDTQELEQTEVEEKSTSEQCKKDKKRWTIEEPEVKITFKRILAYFIIYSFLGFIIETIYGMLTKGVIESRQSCLYGPFCCIYGLGAAIMIPCLQKFKKSNWTLFIAGAIEGSVIEYLISLIGELIFHIKWWDYSYLPFDINGRICLIFTVFWGLLALVLMKLINPHIERTIDRLPKKAFNIITIAGTIFLLLDLVVTGFALKVFYTRLVKENDLKLKNENAIIVNEQILDNEFIQYLHNNIFTDEKMLKTFPNIKFEDSNGNIVWIKDLLPDIQPYYVRISPKITLK
ncbi:MAG: putative ABC transporter permease [Clostridia bacterium]